MNSSDFSKIPAEAVIHFGFEESSDDVPDTALYYVYNGKSAILKVEDFEKKFLGDDFAKKHKADPHTISRFIDHLYDNNFKAKMEDVPAKLEKEYLNFKNPKISAVNTIVRHTAAAALAGVGVNALLSSPSNDDSSGLGNTYTSFVEKSGKSGYSRLQIPRELEDLSEAELRDPARVKAALGGNEYAIIRILPDKSSTIKIVDLESTSEVAEAAADIMFERKKLATQQAQAKHR